MIYIKQKIDLKDFISEKVICGKNNKGYPLSIKLEEDYIFLSYITNMTNSAKREYSLIMPRNISLSEETFEVLGLLQAEMGKTNNGCIVFCNKEYRLINNVMRWFERELELMNNDWQWYIKVNINEPRDGSYRIEIEEKIIKHWLAKTKVDINKRHPKTVTYIKNTKNKKLKFYDYGSLIIEYKSNLMSQIIKNFVRLMSMRVPSLENTYIRNFMKGILAGESTIAYHKKSRHFGVHISASNEEERILYKRALEKIGINLKIYSNYKETLISKRHNLVQLLKQRLMTLHDSKYSKFLNMMQQYPGISEETGYFTGTKKAWNKIPQQKINKILSLYKSGVTRMVEIAEKVGVSKIKVNRVLRENNLGRRVVKTPEEKRKEIAGFVKENPELTVEKIAKSFNVSESTVIRAYKKYGVVKGNKARCKIPGGDIQKIIELYKENPGISKEAVSTI